MDREFREFLLEYSWPGNIRELRNAIERAVLLAKNSKLRLEDLFNDYKTKIAENKEAESNILKFELNIENSSIKQVEKLFAEKVLGKLNGNKSKTAKVLGISRPKLDKLLR